MDYKVIAAEEYRKKVEMGLKRCWSCNRWLFKDYFYKYNANPDKLQSCCKKCSKDIHSRYLARLKV